MTEKELGRALVDVERAMHPGAPTAQSCARSILEDDRGSIRLLAVLATFFWILTAAGLIGLCPFYVMVVAPRLRAYQAGRAQLAHDWDHWAIAGEWIAYWLLACVIALLVASLCTVMLSLRTRKATLRQIRAGLAEITEQLRELRQGASAAPSVPERHAT